MDINVLKNKLADVPADIFATTVIYKMALPFSTKAIKKGLTGNYVIDQCYRETERVGKVKSKYKASNASPNTNTITGQPPKGFTPPTAEDEKGLFYYGNSSGEPYLILQQSGLPDSISNPVNSKYYINGQEADFADVEAAYNNGIFTKKAIEVPGVRDYSLIPVSKITDIIIDEKAIPSKDSRDDKVSDASVDSTDFAKADDANDEIDDNVDDILF